METALNVQDTRTGTTGVGIAVQSGGAMPLPVLIDRATTALANAKSAAEVPEARDMASIAYDMAKATARHGNAKQAHDELIAAALRAQADALVIEAQANCRFADEYDAAQERGEVANGRDGSGAGVSNGNAKATVADIGITRKEIHDARLVRDAEVADPGIVRRTVEEDLAARKEPTKAKVRRAVKNVAKRGKSDPKKKIRPKKAPALAPEETQQERDLRVLQNQWEASCDSAREEFQSTLSAMVSLKQRLTELEDELKELRSSSKCGVAEPPNLTPTVAAVTVNDPREMPDIPDYLRRPL
jgi:hypothetical protein